MSARIPVNARISGRAAIAQGRPDPTHVLGWSEAELATHRYGRHYRPDMVSLAPHVLQALANSPVAAELIPPRELDIADLELSRVRNGYTVRSDGGIHVHLETPMPGVTPEMIDWWFGWHSDSPERYRLWHPRAHLHAEWREEPPAGSRGRDRYVGRTSIVEEYLGSLAGRYAISFRPHAELGITDPRFRDPTLATAVCARIGTAGAPVDAGWLAHLVIADRGGSVMHSRFWLGPPYAALRGGGRLRGPAARIVTQGESEARALLVHCAQEMTHLASFLPALYADEATPSG